jgi:hypothetical protein
MTIIYKHVVVPTTVDSKDVRQVTENFSKTGEDARILQLDWSVLLNLR